MQQSLGPLQRVNVFDARAAALHVDDELGYVFTPAELTLYAHCSTSIQAIQKRIDADVAELNRPPTHALAAFNRGTQAYAMVESLGVATDLHELEKLAAVPKSAADDLAQLEGEVASLTGSNLDDRLATTNRNVSDLSALTASLLAMSDFDQGAYEAARHELVLAQAEVERTRTELFAEGELAGAPDRAWQSFVTAAETYKEHLGLGDYPHENDRCLYCRQDLSAEALDLLGRYRTALDETIQRQLNAATQRLVGMALNVSRAQLEQTESIVRTWGELTDPPAWYADVRTLLSDGLTVAELTVGQKECSVTDLSSRATKLRVEISRALDRAQEASTKLTAQRHDRTAVLQAKTTEAAELRDRIELSRRLPIFRDFVANAKRADTLGKLSADVSTKVRRSLTMASKAASEDLVNRDFVRLFEEECRALNAPSVALDFQGRSGRAERRKLVAKHKPSAILSEGEQKVLALADFLAESRMNGTTAPIVFDDPVNSLDYRRMGEVSKRICRLAEQHQVVVFTHNVMFASALIAQRQTKRQRVKFIEVRENGQQKGVLVPDVEPRLDSPKDLAKRVNVAIEQAKKADPSIQDAVITQAYDLMRSWCEAFIEQEILANVTQRYRQNVMATNLRKIRLDRLGDATSVIDPAFEKICGYIGGHSNPFEQSNVHPTIEELESDWKTLRDARDAYIKD